MNKPNIKEKKIFDTEFIIQGINTRIVTEAWAVDANERNEYTTDSELVLKQYTSPVTARSVCICLRVKDIEDILSACTGTLVGKKSSDKIVYSQQREQVLSELRRFRKEFTGNGMSIEECVNYIIRNINATTTDNGDLDININENFVAMLRLLLLYIELEIIERY